MKPCFMTLLCRNMRGLPTNLDSPFLLRVGLLPTPAAPLLPATPRPVRKARSHR